jgi:hypothetical protein
MICPNYESEAWKELEEAVGDLKAHRIFNKYQTIPDYFTGETKEISEQIETQFDRVTAIRSLVYADLTDKSLKVDNVSNLVEGSYTYYDHLNQLSVESEAAHRQNMDELRNSLTTAEYESILSNIYDIYNRLLLEPNFSEMPFSEQRQALRMFFIKNMYNIDGKPVPFPIGMTAARLENEMLYSLTDESIEAYYNYLEENEINEGFSDSISISAYGSDIMRLLYYDIFRNWDGIVAENNNFTEKAWGQQFEDYLPKRGLTLKLDRMSDVDGGGISFSDDIVQEKIYDKSHLEDSRKDSLSSRIKAFLSDIEKDTVGLLGVNERYDLSEVYTDIVAISTGTLTYKEFLTDLQKEGTNYGKDHLIKVYNKLLESPSDVKMEFYTQLALQYEEFLMLRVEQYGQNTEVKLINSNQYTKRKTILNSWNSQMVRSEREEGRGEPLVQILDGTSQKFLVDRAVADKASETYKNLVEDLKKANSLTDSHVAQFEDLVKTLGMFDKNKDIKPWISQYLSVGFKPKGATVPYKNHDAMRELLRGPASLEVVVNTLAKNDTLERDLMTQFESIIGKIANIQATFDTNLFGSFLNSENKTISPNNLRTPLSDKVHQLKRGLLYTQRANDRYFNPFFDEETHSISKKHKTFWSYVFANPELNNNFYIGAFDGLKEKNANPETYKDFVEKTSFEVRLNLFINRGDTNNTYVVLPTEADRGNFHAALVPRVDGTKSPKTLNQIIESALFQEMMKVARNKELIAQHEAGNIPFSDLYENYHYTLDENGVVTFNGNGLKIGGIFGDINLGEGYDLSVEKLKLEAMSNSELMQSLVNNAITKFNEYVNEQATNMEKRLIDLGVFSTKEVTTTKMVDGKKVTESKTVYVDRFNKELKDSEFYLSGTRLSSDALRGYNSIKDFLTKYLQNEIIHKNEAIKAFRVDKAFSKDYAVFSKRFGTLTTPGYMLGMQGDIATDPEYGFLKELNEIVIKDLTGKNKDLYKKLKAEGYEWYESYNPKNVNATDAQGWMSIDAYRHYLMGQGKWDMVHDEAAFKNYKKGGAFMSTKDGKNYFPRVKPIKPYQEYEQVDSNGITVMHSIKNSYMVLLRDFTKNKPVFEQMRKRMETDESFEGAEPNPYAGLPPIHVINTDSTRKIGKSGIHTVTGTKGEFMNTKVNVLDGNTFRIPQFKPDSDTYIDILLGSQAMRSIMSRNLDSNLFNTYNTIIDSMVRKSMDSLNKELGFKEEGMTKQERTQMLVKLKEKLLSSADSANQGFTKNQLKALDIVDGEFRLPLAFPVFAKRYEQLIFSLFKNEIMNQRINGKQVVQVADAERGLKMVEKGGKQVAQIAISKDIADKLGYKNFDLNSIVNELLGYRIPTQGKNSMLAFEIVEVLPGNYESTIVVPAEITVQMGSDFDIDSLFLMYPNIQKDKYGKPIYVDGKAQKIEVDFNDTFTSETSTEILQNAVFDSFMKVLTNPEYYEDVVRPLDGNTLKNLVKDYKTEGATIGENNFNTEVEYELRNKDGNAGIGIYANALMGHVTGQHMVDAFTLSTQVKLFKDDNIITLSSLNPIRDRSGLLVESNISEHMNVSLDNAKTPLMRALNDNSFTAPITVFMLSLGATLEDVFILRNHPYIKRLTEHYQNNNYTPASLNKAMIEIAEEFNENLSFGNNAEGVLDLDVMSNDIKNNTTNADLRQVFAAFTDYFKAGQDLIKLNKVMTPNRISDMSQNSAIQEYIDVYNYVMGAQTSIEVKKDLFDSGYPLNRAYHDGILSAVTFSKEFFPYHNDQIVLIKEDIKTAIGNKTLNKEQHNFINELIYLWLFTDSNSPLSETFTQSRAKELLLDDNNIGVRFKNLKEKYPEQFSNNILLSLISPHFKNSRQAIQKLHFVNAYANDLGLVDRQIDAFRQLLESPIEELKEFGKDLVDYTLLTTGFGSAAESLIRVIPVEYWEQSGMVEHFNSVIQLTNEALHIEHIADDIIRHNVQTKHFLKTINVEVKPTHVFDERQAEQLGLMSKGSDSPQLVSFFRVYDKKSKKFVLYQYVPDAEKIVYKFTEGKGEAYNLIEINLSGNSNKSILSDRVIKKGENHNPSKEVHSLNISNNSVLSEKDTAKVMSDKKEKILFLSGVSTLKDSYKKFRKEAFDELDFQSKNAIQRNPDSIIRNYIATIELLSKLDSSVDLNTKAKQFELLKSSTKTVQKQLLESSPFEGDPQLKYLEKVFANHGVNVTVEIDNTIEGYGEVEINEDKSVIKVKTKRQVDTEFHEFGHIYVEMMDKVDSKLIDDGIAILQNTELMRDIESLYGEELAGRDLAKEALVTAIGRQATELSNLPKWKVWLNRLWYATRRLFGMANNNVARDLALDLVSGKLRSKSGLLNRVTLTRYQKAKAERSSKLILNMIAEVDKEATVLKQQLGKKDISVIAKNRLKTRLEKLSKQSQILESEIQAAQIFIKDSYQDALRIGQFTERLKTVAPNDRQFLISEIAYTIHQLNKQELLFEAELALKELTTEDVEVFKDMLDKTLEILRFAKNDIINFGIPAMADALLPYTSKEVSDQIEKYIEKVEKGGIPPLTIKKFVDKSAKYAFYKKELDRNNIDTEEFNETIKNLYIEELKNLNPTRENIIAMLQEGFTENNMFSQWLDPAIYSSDQTIQLFTILVKDKLETSREETLKDRDTLFELIEQVEKTIGLKSNVAEMNDKILETVSMSNVDSDGNYSPIEALSLVQELDVNKYYKERADLYDRLTKKYNIPDKRTSLDFYQWKEENPETFKEYNKELSDWYRENTEGIDNWQELLKEKKEQLNELEATKPADELSDEYYNYELLKNEIETFIEERVSYYNNKPFPIKSWTKPKKDKYANPKYLELLKPENKGFLDYYNAIKNFYFAKQDLVGNDYYPNKNKWESHSYLMPSIRKTDQDRIYENGVVDYVKDKTSQLSILDTDSEKIEFNKVTSSIKSVPVYYNGLVDHKEISRDVFKSVLSMASKANDFKAKTSILGHINTFDFLLSNRKNIELDSRGRAILDKFQKRNNAPQSGTMLGRETTEYKHFKEFVDHIIFGEASEKSTFSVGEKEIDRNKLVGQINKFAAYNVFPFNFLQGVANVTHGNVLILEEAFAGRFFNKKDYGKAVKDYIKYLPGIMSDVGKNRPESFLGQIIEYFDAQEGKTMEQLTTNIFGPKFKNITKADQLMFVQKSGELQLAVVPLLAMLHNNKITTKDGKEIALIDAFELKNGRLSVKDNVEFTRTDKVRIINKVNGLNRSLQGIYDKFNRSALSKRWYGKLLLLFRSWMLANFRRNWGYAGKSLRVDHEMGQITEGIFPTFWKFIVESVKEKNLTLFTELSDFEKRNVIKAISRLVTISAAFIIGNLLSGGEDDEWARNFAHYQLRRLRSETLFWLNPLEAMKLLQSPAAGTLIISKAYKLGLQFADPFGEYERKTGIKQKGDNKLYWRFKDLFPVLNNIDKLKTPEESVKYLERIF